MDETQTDLCSTNNSTPCMLQQVSVPLLAAANQDSLQNLIQEVENKYLYAKSADEDYRRGRCQYRCHSLHELR
jgi:hypothetical protein